MGAALLLPLLLLAQDKPPERCTISGTVLNSLSGEPLDKVEVEVEVAGRGGGGAGATTDANGHFSLSNLEPGQYRLKGKRNRFLDTYYGARRAEGTGIPIVVAAGQIIKDLRFKLLPFGVIAGTVRDPEGEPLARVAVTAIRTKFENGRRTVKAVDAAFTDEMGQYRITGLAPGKYYVRVDPKEGGSGALNGGVLSGIGSGVVVTTNEVVTDVPPRSQAQVLLPALYPGVQAPDAAHTVDLDAGARVTGIDIAVPRSGTVTVKGHVSVPEGTRAGIVALNRDQWIGDSLHVGLMTVVDEHGDFTFPSVPKGSYTLTATATGPRAPSAPAEARGGFVRFSGGAFNYTGEVAVDVGTTPVEGVRVVVNPGAEVTGRVVQAGDKGPVVGGSVEFDDGISEVRRADIEDGAFSLDLPQGRYRVYLNADAPQQDSPLLIRSATWGSRDIAGEDLTIAGPGKVALEIVGAPDSGKLDGVVLDKDEKPVAGATVVLIPEPKYRTRNDRYFEAETDQYGHFDLDGVIPGEYKAYAWDDVEPGIWRDPDFVKTIESKGEPVTIKAAGHESLKLRTR